ncbi:MAG: acyl-CoA dehydrogenase family protein, partial [Pseudomonadota bacterium]|nr:acyl-CoA dehydrogenase family protein [Pseudomonadota bacterium]
GPPGQGPSLHRKACDIAAIAQAAEAVGMMEALIRMVVDYTSARKQFGKPLAEFQVLQHRMADMVLNLEDTRSLVYMAALGEPDGPNRDSEIAGMKVHANEALRFVSQQAVQLHGGMGITDDLWVGHFFKRAMVLMAAHGGTPHYRARYEASL